MKTIKMLETRKGTPDGFAVHQYHRNEVYIVTDHLAITFIVQGYAKPVTPELKEAV